MKEEGLIPKVCDNLMKGEGLISKDAIRLKKEGLIPKEGDKLTMQEESMPSKGPMDKFFA